MCIYTGLSDELAEVLSKMMEPSWSERPTTQDLLYHERVAHQCSMYVNWQLSTSACMCHTLLTKHRISSKWHP